MTGLSIRLERAFSAAGLAALLFLVASGGAMAADIEVSISPQPVMAGTPATLDVINSGGGHPEILKLPEIEGIKWGRQASSFQSSFNGRISSKVSYPFTVEKEGSYKIPPLQVEAGGVKTLTKALDFKAVSAKFKGLELDELLFLKIVPPPSRSKFYVGEEIPLEIRLSHLDGLKLTPSWPELEFAEDANIIFRDYKDVNPKNPKFDDPAAFQETINGKQYQTYAFRTSFRAIAPGKLLPSASDRISLWIPETARRNSSLNDDFFFGDPLSRGRNVERMLRAKSEPIEIAPLPPAPEGSRFLGLVGGWKLGLSLSGGACRVGEPLTLKIKVSGEGTLDTLKAPSLEFTGFRVYPPEVERLRGNAAEIRYVLIPTETGDAELSLCVSAFNTAEGRYEKESLSKKIKVEMCKGLSQSAPGQVVLGSQGTPPATDGGDDSSTSPRRKPSDALYLKRDVSSSVEMPLWRNALIPCALLLLAGIASWIACELIHFRRAAIAADPQLARRIMARGSKKSVLKRLKASKPEEIADAAGAELLPYLSGLLDCPPGSGAAEIAAKLEGKDAELAGCLRKIADTAWTPSLARQFDEAFKARLLKAVSKFAAILAIALCSISALQAAEAPSKKLPAIPEEALTAYDSGDFAGAAAFYKSKLDPARPSAQLLYNIGNCLYQEGDLPRALACYERARRLAPRDSDILENLNLTRRRLLLQEKGRIASPVDLLSSARDFLRPDEWAVFACAGLLAAFVSLGVRRFLPGAAWKAGLAAGLAAALAAGAAIGSQSFSSYDEKSAIVIVRNAPVHSLPSMQSGKAEMKLKAGDEVSIEERRLDWARIRSGDAEGWMKTEDIAPLWTPARATAP